GRTRVRVGGGRGVWVNGLGGVLGVARLERVLTVPVGSVRRERDRGNAAVLGLLLQCAHEREPVLFRHSYVADDRVGPLSRDLQARLGRRRPADARRPDTTQTPAPD